MCPNIWNDILIAPDKFKGSLTASEFCAVAKKVFAELCPEARTVCLPLADGGEGSLDCFVTATGATVVDGDFTGPDGDPVRASFAIHGNTAFIEMSATAGLALTRIRNPLYTTTYGVGEQVAQAVHAGATEIVLAIGGSATNDAGCGMAAALGWRFVDKDGNSFVPTGGTLDRIAEMFPPEKAPTFSVVTLCDVENPLFGPDGAAYVYAPQKGASPDDVRILDKNLVAFNALCAAHGKDLSAVKGGGAAGGLGAGTVFFLGASLQAGAETFFRLTDAYDKIAAADLVVTGEGKIDAQTLQGKTVGTLYAAAHGKPFVAFCGKREGEVPFECIEINDPALSLDENMKLTSAHLKKAIAERFS